MNKTSAFRILIPAALALTSAGFAQASVNEVPRMSDDVYRTSVSFCSNVAAAEKIVCQGDMIAAGSRIVAAIGGLPPASAASIDEGARNKLPAAERKGLAPVEPRAIDKDDDVAGLAGMVRLCDVYESEPASRARHHAALKQQAPDAAPRVEALLADASTAARQRVSIGVWQILALEGPEASARACTQLGTGS
ncbi:MULTISPECIES: hypothetical protein [Burkholderia]|uniref:Uncharacterized protein n=1 Tax=Burkholderia cepacia TaxID=292 RepID=A0ABM6P0M0_BURCE|nr:hypothetical protein [Burkholderia cepacia]AIO28699.1 hypothetical protein DM41_3681 [Burkholderia cepacia ATCC 25416]ALK21622.1 hypothetical protein APZ15_28215 [Burkholderia cepacia ATCC 25416]ASE98298.1 hypothetical protein CEQ23_33630 [Burkholderia cepacia]ATF80726.1 hypothetical protein CO711_25205 [Burkholderia cepacia]KVF14717.1 hypothetical protein WJ06_28685 [Burkholderia cepacia]